jgi:YHS domain-containing protein
VSVKRRPAVSRKLALVAVLLFALPAAAKSPVNKTLLGGTAVKGYDVVAYFEDGRALEGSSDFEVEWHGATWRFASAEHRDRFAADPQRYAPQYGGYCAYGMAKGKAVGIDPQAWTIVDGKLYLNYSKKVQALWEQDVPGYVARADANWPGVVEE